MPTRTETPQDQQPGDVATGAPRRPGGRSPMGVRAILAGCPAALESALGGSLLSPRRVRRTWDELQRAVAAGPQRTIDRLLHPDGDVAAFQQAYDENEAGTDDLETARAWWLRRMLLTPHPLLEKLTLFWHGHFAASIDKVGRASMMVRQIQLLRSHALGRFDPCCWPSPTIRRCSSGSMQPPIARRLPSHALGRTFLETYTLGPGVCSPQDIREAARAFSGLILIQGRPRQVEREHDTGTKEVLGHRGNWTGDDVLGFALKHPATPRLVVRKLYRWLISESELPDDDYLAVLSESFGKDYDIARLVETMLRSNLFFSPAAYRQRIKSPVEYRAGHRPGHGADRSDLPLGHDLDGLGQGLYEPPGVKGWAGGRAWINAATILARNNLAWAILSGSGRYGETDRSGGRGGANMVMRRPTRPGGFSPNFCCKATWRPAAAADEPRRERHPSPGGISSNGPARVSAGLKESNDMTITRRDFLAASLGSSTLVALGGGVPGFLARTARAAAANHDARDTILVVVQLAGGNDGLNTVVPYGDDGYGRNRTTLRLPAARLHKIDTLLGFHPEMQAFDRLYKEGRLTIVQGVGYPNHNQQHPVAMRAWQTGNRSTSAR